LQAGDGSGASPIFGGMEDSTFPSLAEKGPFRAGGLPFSFSSFSIFRRSPCRAVGLKNRRTFQGTGAGKDFPARLPDPFCRPFGPGRRRRKGKPSCMASLPRRKRKAGFPAPGTGHADRRNASFLPWFILLRPGGRAPLSARPWNWRRRGGNILRRRGKRRSRGRRRLYAPAPGSNRNRRNWHYPVS